MQIILGIRDNYILVDLRNRLLKKVLRHS